ncbi:MAG: GFA family protein [Pseudomonadota bacterium]
METVTYCHCSDCKRWTGAPLPAFAAVPRDSVVLTPAVEPRHFGEAVTRWMCPDCGSPLAANFAYLPTQTYVPLGILDNLDDVAPSMHAHAQSELAWLHLGDDLPRVTGSARDALNEKSGS